MLELTRITAGYGDTMVLRDVDVVVPSSTVVALLGPNGAGKTTLLRTASGLIPPSSGRVTFDGENVTGRRAFYMARKGLCHLPEGRGIFPSLTVRENLVLASPKGKETASISTAIDAFPTLGSRLKQLAGTLSGGEQQMLALVRAFVSEPRIVVVDEPSLGLAPLVVDQIFDALRTIASNGTALLVVEQYLNRALRLADMVYLMNQGSIVFSGAPGELRSDGAFERYLGIDIGASSRS